MIVVKLREHLDKRLSKTALDTDKVQNTALVILKGWEDYEEKIDGILMNSIINLQKKFHHDDGDNTAGMTKLTAAVSSIGMIFNTEINGYVNFDKKNIHQISALGAMFLECLEKNSYIEINRDSPDYVGSSNKRPNMIHTTHKWCEMSGLIEVMTTSKFSGLRFEKPEEVKGLFDTISKRPILKHSDDTALFNTMLDTDFMAGVNSVRQTGWRVNREVFDAIIRMSFDTTIPMIPDGGSKLDVDTKFKILQAESKRVAKNLPNRYGNAQKDFEEASVMWSLKKKLLKQRSQIIETQITIAKASGLLNETAFFYDVEADYRGRIYYAEPYLNYQGADLAKGMLEFAEGRPMTASGYDWLLRHIACSYNQSFSIDELRNIDYFEQDYVANLEEDKLDNISVDKMSLQDRINWSVANMEALITIGISKELNSNAEKPFMLLAACIDLCNYLNAKAKGDAHLSHLPVPVDGTSNGVQHTAAINLDADTGRLVGLVPSDVPVDLYVKVGQDMAQDSNGYFDSRNMPMKDIRKNISKRSTMTRQYSAGKKKIAEAMFSDCYKNGASEKYNITAQDCEYLAGVAIKSIDNICPSNKVVKRYLTSVASFELGKYRWEFEDGSDATTFRNNLKKDLRLIDHKDKSEEANSKRNTIYQKMGTTKHMLIEGNGKDIISWTTPNGFKAQANLFVKESVDTKVRISGKRYTLIFQLETDVPDVQKHLSAITANMIHSYDSAHMLNTSKTWSEDFTGSFGAVHDSFSVHASDVEDLLKVNKDEFIKMYQGVNMYDYFTKTILSNTDGFDEPKPELGELNLEGVRESDFFFS